MDSEHDSMNRRDMLKRGSVILASLTAGAGVVSRATAASPAKADFSYRESPKDGNKCLDCTAYVADGSVCKVFNQPVSPNGWCMAFSKKS